MKKILKFLLSYNELLTIPVGVILFYYSAELVWALDPQASPLDISVMQRPLAAIVIYFILQGTAFLIFKLIFPRLWWMLDEQISRWLNSDAVTIETKIKYALLMFYIPLICLVLLCCFV